MNETENAQPAWLPDLLDVNGAPATVFAQLYAQFRLDFIDLTCYFRGLPVRYDGRKQSEDDYEDGFWHLISRDDYAATARLLDTRRAEKLAWCAAIISNEEDAAVLVWRFREGRGQIRTYLWLSEWDYVVILEERRRGILQLITAFHVDDRKRHDLEGRYRRREME